LSEPLNRRKIGRYFTLILLLVSLLLSGCAQNSGTPADTGEQNEDINTGEENGMITSAEWNKDETLRILTIGNSFSDDTMEYVYQIAKSAGVKKIELSNLYIGGCTLATHAANAKGDLPAYEYRTTNSRGGWSTVNNYKMSDAIRSKDWDFISMQQASGSSGIPRTYSDLSYMIEYVRSLANDGAVLVWNMTWAYQQNSTHSEFTKYESDQMTMYEMILSAIGSKVDKQKEIKTVSPTGTAIQNARTSFVGDNMTRDGYHLTYDLGRYAAGLTFFMALTGISVEGLEYAPANVDDDHKKVAIESAVNAINAPRQVTKSAYTSAPSLPEFDESKYTKLDLGWTALGYWNSTDGTNHHKIITTASNSGQFYASRQFTKDDIPAGSIIVLKSGWLYRPEAWKSEGAQSGRPDTATVERFEVTDRWWSGYTTRAFNLSKVGTPALSANESGIDEALVIWVPKK